MTVPPEERPHVSLLYGPHRDHGDGRFFVSDGNATVELTACPDRETQFRGGFVVGRPRCAPLDINVGRDPPRRLLLSFGAGTC